MCQTVAVRDTRTQLAPPTLFEPRSSKQLGNCGEEGEGGEGGREGRTGVVLRHDARLAAVGVTRQACGSTASKRKRRQAGVGGERKCSLEGARPGNRLVCSPEISFSFSPYVLTRKLCEEK